MNQKVDDCTLRISGDSELGPLEEKYATEGAVVSPITVLLGPIFTIGTLHCYQKNSYEFVFSNHLLAQKQNV